MITQLLTLSLFTQLGPDPFATPTRLALSPKTGVEANVARRGILAPAGTLQVSADSRLTIHDGVEALHQRTSASFGITEHFDASAEVTLIKLDEAPLGAPEGAVMLRLGTRLRAIDVAMFGRVGLLRHTEKVWATFDASEPILTHEHRMEIAGGAAFALRLAPRARLAGSGYAGVFVDEIVGVGRGELAYAWESGAFLRGSFAVRAARWLTAFGPRAELGWTLDLGTTTIDLIGHVGFEVLDDVAHDDDPRPALGLTIATQLSLF